MERKRAIGAAFGAAEAYDRSAQVQREAAERLAVHIASLGLPSAAHILEIGCGTGFLASALHRHGVRGAWVISDLSPVMVARSRKALDGLVPARFLAMDGEAPCFGNHASFDLICSSLAFQWFENLEAAIARLTGLLAPGGHLVFTTMLDGSFSEWRAAHRQHGLEAATPRYPSAAELAALAPLGITVDVVDFQLCQTFADGRDFLRNLRDIGAHVPKPGWRPLVPGMLRKVLRSFEAGGASASYHIACCTFTRLA